mmetsp:Transcript_11270/g.15906  ORF Transcript_11270/g.15906 Transcript_11270/m.15906 type:complete len:83 (-) Transcript_11270:796-1044(-)
MSIMSFGELTTSSKVSVALKKNQKKVKISVNKSNVKIVLDVTIIHPISFQTFFYQDFSAFAICHAHTSHLCLNMSCKNPHLV